RQGRIVPELSLSSGAPAAQLGVILRIAPFDGAVVQGLTAFGTEVRPVGIDRVEMRAAGDTAVAAAVSWLVGRGVSVYAVESRRKSLEAWFVEVMGDDQRPG